MRPTDVLLEAQNLDSKFGCPIFSKYSLSILFRLPDGLPGRLSYRIDSPRLFDQESKEKSSLAMVYRISLGPSLGLEYNYEIIQLLANKRLGYDS